jgi:CRP/FNR family cyclic AMP-dependent transcriptional regulator
MAADMTPGTNRFKHDPDTRTYEHGEMIFAAGDTGHEMYVVQDGLIEIVIDGMIVETLGAGGIFGEGALIDDSHHRAAGARAASDVRVAVIDERRFKYLVERSPFFAIEVMRALAYRLRRTTLLVSAQG